MAGFPAELFRMEGDPGAIRGSAVGWSEFGAAASAASGQILSLDTSEFVGSEGDQFRANLTTEMPPHLRITGDAFGQVAAALGTFAGALAGLQDRMRPLAAQAPGLWQELQAAKARLAAADPADKPAALAALRAAQQRWDACEAQATALRAELATAVQAGAAAVDQAAGMRFIENPGRWDLAGNARNFVQDHKEGLQQLSTGLKIVSAVAGVLSFVPVLTPIAAPIALGTALAASAIDLSVYAATGEGALSTVLIDVGLTLLPLGRILSGLRTAVTGARAVPTGVPRVGAAVPNGNPVSGLGSTAVHAGNANNAVVRRLFPELAETNPLFRRTPATSGAHPDAGGPGFQHNCQSCVTAVDRQLAGSPTSAVRRDVGAVDDIMGSGAWKQNLTDAVGNGNTFKPVGGYDDVVTELQSAGDGARGIIHGTRIGATGREIPGHVFNVVNRNGRVYFLDGQTGTLARLENFHGLELLRTN